MRKVIFSLSLMTALSLSAQQKQGGISPQMLQQIEQQNTPTASDRALRNALAANAIDNLAQNRQNAGALDTYFSVETKKQSITDQKSSGRCWMFSGLNVLRANFAQRTDSLSVLFSQDYLFFWDQLEKANLMLQGVIDTSNKPIDDQRVQFFFHYPLNDGGTFCGVADLAEKYGLVPADVQPETYSADNTSKMSSIIKSKLREQGLELRKMVAEGKKAKAIEQRKTQMLSEIYHMLTITLGEPIKEFTYDEVEYDRHVYDGHNWKYLNLPMEEIEQLAIASLKDGRKLYSSYDVGKQLDRKRGYCDLENFDYASLFNTSFNMTKAERISTFDSGSTHAMTLTAVDLDANGQPVKWKVENSWGGSWGQQGCLIMTARWFREYMFRLVVDKKYASEKLLKDYEQKPVMVMPEDPLFQMDE